MAVYRPKYPDGRTGKPKRSRIWWYCFRFRGELIRRSTKQKNKRVAEQMEAAHKTALAKGQVGIVERPPAPTLAEWSRELSRRGRFLAPASINRELATLRRLLRLAWRWKIIAARRRPSRPRSSGCRN